MRKKRAQHFVGVRKKDSKAQVMFTTKNSPYCKNVFKFMVGPFETMKKAQAHSNSLNGI